MHRPNRESAPLDLARATEREIERALVHWDELDDRSLASLAEHPRHGARLRRLRAAESWLTERAVDPGDCPSSEELYDFGRGPGARPLLAEQRAGIEDHLAGCADCSALVTTLASSPPLPLEAFEPSELEPAQLESEERAPAPVRSFRRPHLIAGWALPIAAAAAALLFLPLPWGGGPEASFAGGLPEPPLLRGEDPGALRLPRGRTLFVTAAGAWYGLASGAAPRYELHVPPGTSAVRVELARHDGGAFGSDEPVAVLAHELDVVGESPVRLDGEALEPGSYTWRAWARVDGLERELGARDFSVERNEELETLLQRLSSLREPGRTEAAVRLLQDAGYLAEARALVRSMPASAERDRYLDRFPGR